MRGFSERVVMEKTKMASAPPSPFVRYCDTATIERGHQKCTVKDVAFLCSAWLSRPERSPVKKTSLLSEWRRLDATIWGRFQNTVDCAAWATRYQIEISIQCWLAFRLADQKLKIKRQRVQWDYLEQERIVQHESPKVVILVEKEMTKSEFIVFR